MEIPENINEPLSINIERERVSNAESNNTVWKIFGEKIPREEVQYFCQVFMIFIVIIASIINLSIQNEYREMWISFFGYALGTLVPHPKMKNSFKKLGSPISK